MLDKYDERLDKLEDKIYKRWKIYYL
jgi:hypothetical protein